ncbi:hypothetical protein [Candidatus Poriferisodalis sp.]|uniref:hypothetical protein n=1 Tax=Candidatus Poriferisodalis sp. TaxID=3101277 RepID=UPI003B5A6B16
MKTRIRWPLVGVFAASASGLLLMAVAGGGWTLESWSNALLAIASGLMVLLVGVIVEPRLFRRVEAAVSDAVQAGTAPLAKRVMDLETLAASQAEQRRAVDDEIADAVAALRSAASRDAVADALRLGEELRLFDPHMFRLRTSKSGDGPDLFALLMEYGNVSELWLNFDPVLFGSLDPTQWDLYYGPDEENPVGIIWLREQSATEIVGVLERNMLADDIKGRDEFDFARALDMLALSLQVAFAARSGNDASIGLRGPLICLVNDEWAVTAEGLESLLADRHYPIGDDLPTNTPCPSRHSPDLCDTHGQESQVIQFRPGGGGVGD